MSTRPSASAAGGNSTWGAQPSTGDWYTAANWNPASVPTGTATFGSSSQTGITFAPNGSATVDSIVFAAGAPSYTISFNSPAPDAPALTIAGAGVSNNSTSAQRFVVASSAAKYQQAQLRFANSASAGGTDISYAAGPATPAAAGGGVIGFSDQSTAGSANFTVTTGAGAPPKTNSTVGGEVSFSNSASAGSARFTIYGSTSTVNRGDTFGNVVFHDTATAANATFTNVGGTLPNCDGGNTQFYDSSNAGSGLFHNLGGTAGSANGGDVAFDGTASAASGCFHNQAATVSGGRGGVTSFNNNWPPLSSNSQGASAGKGVFYNYGGQAAGFGGGHTYFESVYGSPTADGGTFVNYGSAVPGDVSTVGRTVLSITLPQQVNYYPTGGNGVFWNFPGTAATAPGGYTEFAVYQKQGDDEPARSVPAPNATLPSGSIGPTAGNGTFINLGTYTEDADGGQTKFIGAVSAGNAQLIATGGGNGGNGGAIVFIGQASGGTASVHLTGNGTLDIADSSQPKLTLGALSLAPGCIVMTLGTSTTCLVVSGLLEIPSGPASFVFDAGAGFVTNTPYTILTASNLASFTVEQFSGNSVNRALPTFTIVGNSLQVSFSPARR